MTQTSDVAQQIGRYRILSELGRGSMGRVYLAEDPNIGRQVALKVFSPEGVDPEMEREFQQRFVTEARAAGRLNHPGIVTVYDAGTDQGVSYIAMEWVRGESLHHMLGRLGRLPVAIAVDFVAQAALALDYAHGEGVIHRDVKPANVLVGKDGRVKVMDFGIAKLGKQAMTMAGVVLGTPAYMSPEQVRGEPVDGRSDLFSLGAVLYRCLTGIDPFEADSIPAITYRVVHVDVPWAHTADPAIPEPLAAVAARAIAKSPDERFQTGAELAQALAAVAGEAPAPAAAPELDVLDDLKGLEDLPPLDSTVFTGRPAVTAAAGKRRRILSTAAVAALAVLGLAGWWWRGRSAEPIAEDADLTPAPIVEDAGRTASPVAADAGQTAAPGGEAPPTVTAEPPAGAPAEAPNAAIEVLYENRLRQAVLAVWIDDVQVWSQEISAKNPFKRVVGQHRNVAIPLVAGRHAIEVRVSGSGVDAVRRIEGSVAPGATRTLRVSLKRRENELELEWVD